MGIFTDFLESSSIGGLNHIATGRKYIRLFWILVVLTGFIGAGVLIYQSFESWQESPVKTTIETLPISQITLPKVTVCPPKNTYTDLNYDLMMTENMTLDDDTRNVLMNYAKELLYENLYEEIIKNISMVEENDRYYNWYHGYTKIEIPVDNYYDTGSVEYNVNTAATSGTISTKYFGDKFDADKVETNLHVNIRFDLPYSVKNNQSVTLHFDIEKSLMKDLSSGDDYLEIQMNDINMDFKNISKSYTPPGSVSSWSSPEVSLVREVPLSDVRKQTLNLMPGFKISWYYSGMEVEPWAKFQRNSATAAFIRKDSNESTS